MKHRLRLVALGLCLLLLLAACSKGARPPKPADPLALSPDPVTIKLVTIPYGNTVLTVDLLRAFRKKHPHINVEVVHFPVGPGLDPVAFLKEQLTAGPVDVVQMLEPVKVVEANLIEPLDSYITASKLDLEPYGPGLDALRINGKLYDLPVFANPMVLVGNPDMFQAAGLSRPRDGWTWEEFREVAKRLTKSSPEGTTWGFSNHVSESAVWAHLIQQHGTEGMPPSSKALREAVSLFNTMVHVDRSMSPAKIWDWPDAGGPTTPLDFHRGEAAMTIDLLPAFIMAGNALRVKWDILPMPTAPGARGGSLASTDSYGVAAESQHKAEAWELLRFLAGPEGAVVTAAAGALPMYVTADAKRAWFEGAIKPGPGSEVLFASRWVIFPRTSERDSRREIDLTWWTEMNNGINRVLSGRMNLDEMIRTYTFKVEGGQAGR